MKRKKSAYWAVCCWLGLAVLGYALQPLFSSRNTLNSERHLLERAVQTSLVIDAENSSVADRQELLDLFLPAASNFELIPARLIPSRDLSPLRRSALIDRGSESRIAAGMGVICSNGIVGKVDRVGDGWSRIQLADDPAFVIPFQNEFGQRGILAGGPLRGNGHPKLRLDPVVLEEGGLLYTDGSGGVYPPSLFVGTVERANIPVSDSLIRLPDGISQGQEILVLSPLDNGGSP